ncbi:sterol desaturase family protein [uncultured Parvibaculum sp.]|uniref:sterol desaturase family protein n=1 Tax=uncultured Parvibaculum sp. TaxID=291828 RepID=UPI0030DC9231
MAFVRFLLRYLYLPAMLLGTIGSGILLIEWGWPKWSLVPLGILAILISFMAERVVPYRDDWNRNIGDGRRDAWHAVVNEALNIASIASVPVIAVHLALFDLWPSDWPFWLQALGAILILDLGITFAHFASHRISFLWRFHAVHHSVKRMYGFNGLMKHPVHQSIEMAVGTAPLVLIGLPYNVGAVLGLAVLVQLLLQHSNVRYAVGPLRYILAVNSVHRFHHQKEAGAGDVNFGLFTTLGDRILGSYWFDRKKIFRSEDLGIGDRPDYPMSYGAQLIEPFRRQRRAT